MLEIAQGIDDGNAGVLGHRGDGRVSEGAQNDAIDPALEVVSDVAQLLAGIDARSRLIDEERMSTHTRDAGFEGQACAQRRLLEKHDNLFARQGAAKIRWTLLHQRREIKD